jgi:cytochrome c oxidase assembly protein Cox11
VIKRLRHTTGECCSWSTKKKKKKKKKAKMNNVLVVLAKRITENVALAAHNSIPLYCELCYAWTQTREQMWHKVSASFKCTLSEISFLLVACAMSNSSPASRAG